MEMRGKRITAMSTAASCLASNRVVRLSSSSREICMYGTTPTTGTPPRSSSIRIPGASGHYRPEFIDDKSFYPPALRLLQKKLCPEQLRNIHPGQYLRRSSTARIQSSASPMFTISFSFKLISAGLSAPSITMMSACSSSLWYAARMSGTSFFL